MNPRSVKALYRACRGFLALDRVEDARGCCDLALELDPENAELKQLSLQVAQRAERIAKRDSERKERERRKQLTAEALRVAFLVCM